MKNLKIKAGTIARIVALVVALANQCLALFGQGALPFTSWTAYQVATFVLTVTVGFINAWYNNDFTQAARLTGALLDAIQDGKVTSEEVSQILDKANENNK